jgi:hypothetical protein
MTGNVAFLDALCASGPLQDHAEKLQLYGQFVGSWELQVLHYSADPSLQKQKGEVHFAWALQGSTVQDVWILPVRSQRSKVGGASGFYGTTLRVYDPKADAWRITWINPGTGVELRMLGRSIGNEIVQEGTTDAGARLRWRFSEITGSTFRWRGALSTDAGQTWTLQADFRLRRA